MTKSPLETCKEATYEEYKFSISDPERHMARTSRYSTAAETWINDQYSNNPFDPYHRGLYNRDADTTERFANEILRGSVSYIGVGNAGGYSIVPRDRSY